MRRDPTLFRERFKKWKTGELVYDKGLPCYKNGKNGKEKGFGNVPGIKFVRQRLYDNIMPMGYDDPAERIFNALILNKNEDQTFENFKQSSDAYKVLDNIWGLYLHIPQSNRKTKDPKYSLSKNIDGTYSLKYPNVLYNDIKLANLPSITKYQKVKDGSFNTLYKNFDVKLNLNTNAHLNFVLGDFQILRKIDPHIGEYIEYSDTWDVNPFQKTTNLYGQLDYKDRSIYNKILSKLVPKNGDASFGVGTPIPIKGKISLEDLYNVPKLSTAPRKGDYYGGWLPEIKIIKHK